MTSAGDRCRERLPALDGLRGLAAFVVVFHHILMTNRALADLYLGRDVHGGALEWAVVASPLRLVWAGDAAVAVFFVLSGYVLTRPFLYGAGGPWSRFYPRRLLRLYLPVWAALSLTVLLVLLVPRTGQTGNPWIDQMAVPFTVRGLVNDATLAAPDAFLSQLWSLQWEVLFSLLLPFYLPAVRWLARFGSFGFLPLITVTWISTAAGELSVTYMTEFAFGSLLAALEAQNIRSSRGRRWDLVIVTGAVAAMTVRAYPILAVGATAAVAVALRDGRIKRLLEGRCPQWLGKVSFSLYLVHLPIVLVVAAMGANLPATIALAILLSLAAAFAFHRVVEAPSQWLAARVRAVPRKPVTSPVDRLLSPATGP